MITIARTTYTSALYEVEAEDVDSAREKAYQIAYDDDWTWRCGGVEYECESVEIKYEAPPVLDDQCERRIMSAPRGDDET
jgi:hypothetical protein